MGGIRPGARKITLFMPDSNRFHFYLSGEHPCSYLPGRNARTLFPDPRAPLDTEIYGALIDRGFRRSGHIIYRPECSDCQSCIPVRIPTARFKPRRSHRRIWRKGQGIEVLEQPPEFSAEHFALYSRYIQTRHPDGEMALLSERQYMEFLYCDWCETRFFEFRLERQLLAVAVTDLLPQGLSAVYTFFDPRFSQLGLGVFSILWQIRESRHRQLPWLYLGYWIPGCRKMEYKGQYRPLQAYRKDRWQELRAGEAPP